MSNETAIRFKKEKAEKFFPTVRKRVNSYFKENNISKHANGAMIAKTTFIIGMFLLTYFMILSNLFSPGVMLVLAMINGFFTALIGLNIAHDAIHGSYSSNQKVNNFFAICFNIIGANDHVWKVKHNMIHHTFTNIPDHDDDINQPPIIRFNPNQKRWWIHRFQHMYVFLIYPMATLAWVFLSDYVSFFKPQVQKLSGDKKERRRIFLRMIFFKMIYYTLFLAVPLLFIQLPWYQILFGFVMLHIVEGLTLSLVFQLAHVVEGAAFPEPDKEGNIQNSWAVHQMYTTADFARNNPLVNFIFGGLNFQIEHHLFPQVCHTHYKKIAPIVEETAKEFGLPYINNKTFTGALLSHIRLIKQFGAKDKWDMSPEGVAKAAGFSY